MKVLIELAGGISERVERVARALGRAVEVKIIVAAALSR
jgi:hypothetical protein